MRALWDRVSIGWCRTFHPKPFWPVHGRYRCPTCLRTHPFPSKEGDNLAGRERSRTDPGRGLCVCLSERSGMSATAYRKR
jgi:hypothetical protein